MIMRMMSMMMSLDEYDDEEQDESDFADQAMRAVRDVTEARVRFSGDEGGSGVLIIQYQQEEKHFKFDELT